MWSAEWEVWNGNYRMKRNEEWNKESTKWRMKSGK